MVLNTIVTLVVAAVLLTLTATVVRLVGGNSLATLIAQNIVLGAGAYAVFTIGFVGLPVAIAVAAMPIVMRVIAYVWLYRQGQKFLRGDYGEEAQWAAELAKSDDRDFITASNKLSEMQLREIGIMSDSKEELRKNTIERAEEGQE